MKIRQAAAQGLDVWNQARFMSEQADVERLFQSGDLQGALRAEERLLQSCLAAGDTAYAEAPYSIAVAYFHLGRMLEVDGAAEAALTYLDEAQRRFEALAEAGNNDATQMTSTIITDRGNCLRALGRLDEAAAAYEEAIKRSKNLDVEREVAIGKSQLGYVRLLQGRYPEALTIYTESRDTFTTLGEPGSVATAWYQIGMVHRCAGQYDQAESAYQQSLAMKVQQQDHTGEANVLNELGNLYNSILKFF